LMGNGAHLVGHSYGGLGALFAAARRPHAMARGGWPSSGILTATPDAVLRSTVRPTRRCTRRAPACGCRTQVNSSVSPHTTTAHPTPSNDVLPNCPAPGVRLPSG
jgi:pimeloyl-ACP methyl ester carboxylesterase